MQNLKAKECYDHMSDLKRLIAYGDRPKCSCSASEHFDALLNCLLVVHSEYYSHLAQVENLNQSKDEILEEHKLIEHEFHLIKFENSKLKTENDKLNRQIEIYSNELIKKEEKIKELVEEFEKHKESQNNVDQAANNMENKNESLTESPKIEADSNIDATTTNILIENKPSEVELDSEFAHIEIEHENIPILTEVIEDSTTFKKDGGNIKKDTKTPETSSSGSRSDLTELVNNIDKYLERKLNHSEGHVENFSVSIDNPNIPLLSDNSPNPDVSTNVLEISTPAIVTNSNPKKSAWYKAKKKIKKENYYKTLDARSRRCITNINKINILSLDQYGTHNSHVELSSTLDTFLQETIKEGKSKKKKKNIKGEQH